MIYLPVLWRFGGLLCRLSFSGLEQRKCRQHFRALAKSHIPYYSARAAEVFLSGARGIGINVEACIRRVILVMETSYG